MAPGLTSTWPTVAVEAGPADRCVVADGQFDGVGEALQLGSSAAFADLLRMSVSPFRGKKLYCLVT
jgi:hypothetical protein